MIVTALVLFAVAALGGLILAGKHLRNQQLPMPLALIHGVVAAAGLVVLIAGAISPGGATALLIPATLFVIAALGGFVLFAGHLRGKRHSTAVVFIHGGVALVAFAALLVAALKG
jgi:glucose uptake protein GlcU